ncbi:MAG: hypothetical protein EU548_00660 [Promethearchaeota archaeon]|nr:MAG: hypothetical protein EU548_00660 [Candidatus Lokiarchaeota archaeon]
MEKYYCTECKRYHYRGKIYQEHLSYKKKKDINSLKKNEIDSLDLERFRPIAQRQISRLLIKMESTGNHELYSNEISKIINKELGK